MTFNKGDVFLKQVTGFLFLSIVLAIVITFLFPFVTRYLFLYQDINAIFQLSNYILLAIILKNILDIKNQK